MRIATLALLFMLGACNGESSAPKEKKEQPHEGCNCGDKEEPESGPSSIVASLPTSQPALQIIEASTNEHAHKAPHNGDVKTVGSLHLELVWGAGDQVELYILDEKLAPVQPKEALGSITLNNGEKITLAYEQPSSRLSGKVSGDEVLTEVTIEDKLYRARFKRGAKPHHH